MQYAELENAINFALTKVGVKGLIEHIRSIHFKLNYKLVWNVVLSYFNITETEFYSDSKKPKIVAARRILIYMLSQKTEMSAINISTVIGTTERNYYRQINHLQMAIDNPATDPFLNKSYIEIQDIFNNKVQEYGK